MKKARYFVPSFLYYVLIFFLSSQSGDFNLPGHRFDKIAHLFEFSLLGFFLSFGYFKTLTLPSGAKSILALITGLTLGLLDELHQLFVPGRTSALWDVAADGAGVAIGILVYMYLAKRKKRSPETGVT